VIGATHGLVKGRELIEESIPHPNAVSNANYCNRSQNFKGFIGQDCGEGPKGGLQLEPQS
jgi:hypothetical protein